jgi:hypothetical protein
VLRRPKRPKNEVVAPKEEEEGTNACLYYSTFHHCSAANPNKKRGASMYLSEVS